MKQTINRILFSKVNGEQPVAVSDVAIDINLGELLDAVVPRMNLQKHDSSGRPLEWSARLSREGRTVFRNEVVGETLRDEDELVLAPNVDAGMTA
ncbi:MAG: hypothetical protein ABMA01_01830 [Chthoniobacteraceae bacterium]